MSKVAKGVLEKKYKRQDEWVRQNRERINIVMPKGTRERIAEVQKGSLNEFFRNAIDLYIEHLKNEEEVGKVTESVEKALEE